MIHNEYVSAEENDRINSELNMSADEVLNADEIELDAELAELENFFEETEVEPMDNYSEVSEEVSEEVPPPTK